MYIQVKNFIISTRMAMYLCTQYEGELQKDENEVKDLHFFNLNEIPSNISPPDLPIIREFINNLLSS
jgi:NADH pyrophosphatase NudC (nudix superfamily)